MHHSLDVFDVAKILKLPTIVTCHDYYFACPNHLLLDEKGRFCDGVCTPGDGDCNGTSDWTKEAPALKHGWVSTWRTRASDALTGVDAITFPSSDTEERYARLLPAIKATHCLTIEHGLDVRRVDAAEAPTPGGRVRILFPGHIGTHKGMELIRSLHDIDVAGRLELHFMGRTSEPTATLGTTHGEYKRADFASKVSTIRPAFIGIFSIFPETFCYVLSEAWLAGVPVIGTDVGAVRQRIEREGGGWTFDVTDVASLYRSILDIADNPSEYHKGLQAARSATIRSTEQMAGDYEALYALARENRLAFNRRTASRPTQTIAFANA
jgi:glycosyltransferase involved in cell wall biosynthesis